MTGRIIFILVGVFALSACSNNPSPQLMNVRADNNTPDEFSILPTRALEQPDDYTTLPEPTPGSPNRADRNPSAEAIAALGGQETGGVRSTAALVQSVNRFGVNQDIRATLAEEDLAFRQRNNGRLLERLLNVTVYFEAYSAQSLDKYRELERLRRAGVRTPAAPPEPQP